METCTVVEKERSYHRWNWFDTNPRPVVQPDFGSSGQKRQKEGVSLNEDWYDTAPLWKYQYVQTNCPLIPQLRHVLYYESQGIVDIAVKVYLLAQIEAMTNRTEVITEESLMAAAHHRLGFVRPFLTDLRNNVSPEKIEAPEDVAEVNLGQIVQEELERTYACGSPRTFREEKNEI